MDDIQSIEHEGVVYAIFFRADITAPDGMRFMGKEDDPLQVGIFEREKGYEVQVHRHCPRDIHLKSVGEFLWIQSGKTHITIFDDQWNSIGDTTLETGDCAILIRGGHGLTMLEPTRILEVKQGPYPGKEKEKIFRDSK